MSTANPHIEIKSPFNRLELPSLFIWLDDQRSLVADDEIPRDLDAFMDFQLARQAISDITTFGVFKDNRLAGYIEAQNFAGLVDPSLVDELRHIAQVSMVFKRECYGLDYTVTALNLALREIFAGDIASCYFPVFTHNAPLKKILFHVGARTVGAIKPRLQNGRETEAQMWAATRVEWQARNAGFFAEVKSEERESKETVPVVESAGVEA